MVKKKRVLFLSLLFCLINITNIFADTVVNENKVIIPVRRFFERSGYSVIWSDETKEVDILNDKSNSILTFGKENSKKPMTILDNKAYFYLDDFKNIEVNSKLEDRQEIMYIDENIKANKIDDTVPNFVFIEKGEIKDFYSLLHENQKTIVLFWASWCPNCNEVINLLENEYKKYSDLTTNIVTINIDDEPQFFKEFPVKNDITKEVFKNFGGQYIPTAYIVSDKRIESVAIGGEEVLGVFKGIE